MASRNVREPLATDGPPDLRSLEAGQLPPQGVQREGLREPVIGVALEERLLRQDVSVHVERAQPRDDLLVGQGGLVQVRPQDEHLQQPERRGVIVPGEGGRGRNAQVVLDSVGNEGGGSLQVRALVAAK